MRYTDRPKEPISTKHLIYGLLQARPAMHKMREMNKEYEPLIAVLLLLDSEAKLPTAKVLQQQLGIGAGVLRRWLEAWHSDFLSLIENDADVLQFRQVEYLFCVPGPRDYLTFKCRLAVPPQVGEGVDVPFVSGATGSGVYHVDSVSHEYLHDRIMVTVRLRDGYYDPYIRHLRHRARFEKTLTWEAASKLSWLEEEERLYELYGQPTPPAYNPPVPSGQRRWR